MNKKVLGLDIGSNSIGFSLLELSGNENITFNEIVSNSIIFSDHTPAQERREARSLRRIHERKSARNKRTRKIYVDFNIASTSFIDKTTQYLNDFKLKDNDVYNIREKAMKGINLSVEEFILCSYSALTKRGYNNMFSTPTKDAKEEDGLINNAIMKNKEIYKSSKYLLPSSVLVSKRNDSKD